MLINSQVLAKSFSLTFKYLVAFAVEERRVTFSKNCYHETHFCQELLTKKASEKPHEIIPKQIPTIRLSPSKSVAAFAFAPG